MKTKDIYLKTMKFVWLKLALGAAVIFISIVLLALFMGIGILFNNPTVLVWMFIFWIAAVAMIYSFAMHYVGYMIKAAHVAVISTAVTTGQIPDNMVEAGKEMVKKRFAEANAYFVMDRLISGAVKQLQNAVGKIDNIFGGIPGVSTVVSIVQIFIGIALGYVDECCLGYTFVKSEEGAFKAGCDGVVIYFQNAKHLLKDAAVTTLVVVVSTFILWLLPFVILGVICRAFNWSGMVAFFIAIMIAVVVKAAFVDSYMMVKMMVSYMEVAPGTEISFDLYDKLCKLSRKFKELFEKAKTEISATVA